MKTKECNKGCGTLIYFDEQHKSEKGRWVPLEADTNKPHECPNSDYNSGGGGGQTLGNSTANKRISDLEERVTALEEKQMSSESGSPITEPSEVEEFSCDNCDGERWCTKECECNECEADRIRKKVKVRDATVEGKSFRPEKYKDYTREAVERSRRH